MQTGESVGAGGARHEDEEWPEAPLGLKGDPPHLQSVLLPKNAWDAANTSI